MTESYTCQYNQVVRDEAVLAETLVGKYPFQYSEWKVVMNASPGPESGELLRATFLSGGSVYTSHAAYLETLAIKARDLERGHVLTDTEVAHNCEGIRLFMELDYRTSAQLLPTWDEALLHIRLIYRTVHECFPALDAVLMHVAICTPKRKQRRSSDAIELAWGVHIVFPDIVTTTSTMLLVAHLLDTRLSNAFPQWGSILDAASYRSRNATLRPCFSYKMVDCPICNHKRPSPLRTQLIDICACYNGKYVDPSIYTYAGSLRSVREPPQYLLDTKESVLRGMSIIPPVMGQFTPGFTRPADMGEPEDPVSRTERVVVQGFQRTAPMELHRNPTGYHALLQVITRIHAAYAHVAIQKLLLDERRRLFVVVVKGHGSRYCMYRSTQHVSNRVFFSVNLTRGRIYMHCFDPECKRAYGKNPLCHPLARRDKTSLTAAFAMSDPDIRPTAVSLPIVTPTTESRRRKWEEKARAYQHLVASSSSSSSSSK